MGMHIRMGSMVHEEPIMEYPGRSDRTWQITVYDRNDKPMYHEKGLSKNEADSLAERWLARNDVLRVEGKDAGR